MKNRNLWLYSAIWFLLFVTSSPPTHAFIHPGISHSYADLNRMKSNVNVEPYKTAFEAFKSQGYSDFNNKGQGPTPTGSQFVLRNDAHICYNNAIMWYVTGDVRYRDNAIRLMNAWANTLTSFDPGDHITAGGAAFDFCNAGEIIRATGRGAWAPADIARFQKMLLTYLYPACLTPGGGHLEAAGHGGLQMKGLFAIGVFCDRQDIFDFGVSCYKHNSGWTYGLQEYIDASSQNYETQRDQGHASGAVGTFAVLAYIARNQGIDLFPLANNLLARGFETQAKINLMYDVAPVPYKAADGSFHSKLSGDSRSPYDNLTSDLAYHIFHDIKGLAMPYTKMSADVKFPDGGESFLYRVDDSGKVPVKPLYGGPAPTGVQLFEDSFAGTYLTNFGPGKYDADALKAGGVWAHGSGAISSIRVPHGWTVRLFDHDDLTGDTIDVVGDHDLGPLGWNDRPNSMIVTGGGPYIVADSTYKIINRGTGLTLTVSGGSSAEGAAVAVSRYVGGWNQLWRVENLGQGQYTLINLGSGKALEVGGTSPADGAALDQRKYVPSPDLATGGTASGSAPGSEGEHPAQAFDGNPDSKWFGPPLGKTGWLQYQFAPGTPQAVTQYRITSASDAPERDPADWQFQGSDDGTNWKTLDTQTGQTFSDRQTTNTYSAPNQKAYLYYRLNVTNTKGGNQGVQLAELGLYSSLTGGVQQRWVVSPVPGSAYGSFFSLKNARSGKLLTAGTAPGTALRQDADGGSAGQQWGFAAP